MRISAPWPSLSAVDKITLRSNLWCDSRLDVSRSDLTYGQEPRQIDAAWLRRRVEEERRDVAGAEQEDVVAAGVPVEIETPVTCIPHDLPTAAIDTDIPSPISQAIQSPSILHDVESSPEASSETFVEVSASAPSSPTLSISTISDMTPTELGEDIGEGSDERIFTPHKTFYLEDGNVEIVCGHTIFRVHSPVVSFSSSKLRDMLSPSTLLNAPTPEGCPRIFVKDSSEDFMVLLKMIYVPGWVSLHPVDSVN